MSNFEIKDLLCPRFYQFSYGMIVQLLAISRMETNLYISLPFTICVQFVIVSLTGWGILIFGGYKFFTRGKGKKEEVFIFLKFNPSAEIFFYQFLVRLL